LKLWKPLKETAKSARYCIEKVGFALIEDKKSVLMRGSKILLFELVHYSEKQLKVNFSDYLSQKLNL